MSITLISSYSSAAYVKTTTDPTLIGIGARPTGTGKAFVGLADDANAIFLNPAGLAGQKTWQVQSMTTRLLNVIDYVSFAGTYNTNYGTFGLGYVGANLSGSFATGTLELGEQGVIPSGLEDITYSSTVILLSYGSEAKRFLSYNWLDKVSVGATLKIFSQGLSGGNISEGLMSGYNMDIGFLYKPSSWLSFGLDQVDALPIKLTEPNGTEHVLDTTTKLGMAIKVLGEDSLYGYSQSLVYLLDMDYSSARANYPTLMRTGMEWWPSNYLAIRFGLDQDVIGSDKSSGFNVETNLAAGIGMQYNGFKFDYAYHKYGAASDNDTSYLSLTYAAPVGIAAPPQPAPPPPSKEKKDYIKISSPQDKLITYDEGVVIKGKVLEAGKVSKLTINGGKVAFFESGSFEATYPLLIGKNTFDVTALDGKDNVLSSVKIRVLRLMAFKDVPEKYWAKEPIELIATLGMTGGYKGGTFKPEGTIDRANLTALLVRAKSTASIEAVNIKFSDVPKKYWAYSYIRKGIALGFVSGYSDNSFKPSKAVTRAEGVLIFSKFAELKPPKELIEGPFPDVPGRHWAAKSIAAARSAGLLLYLTDKPFEPNKAMTRAEAIEILSKTSFIAQKINNLKDFDSY